MPWLSDRGWNGELLEIPAIINTVHNFLMSDTVSTEPVHLILLLLVVCMTANTDKKGKKQNERDSARIIQMCRLLFIGNGATLHANAKRVGIVPTLTQALRQTNTSFFGGEIEGIAVGFHDKFTSIAQTIIQLETARVTAGSHRCDEHAIDVICSQLQALYYVQLTSSPGNSPQLDAIANAVKALKWNSVNSGMAPRDSLCSSQGNFRKLIRFHEQKIMNETVRYFAELFVPKTMWVSRCLPQWSCDEEGLAIIVKAVKNVFGYSEETSGGIVAVMSKIVMVLGTLICVFTSFAKHTSDDCMTRENVSLYDKWHGCTSSAYTEHVQTALLQVSVPMCMWIQFSLTLPKYPMNNFAIEMQQDMLSLHMHAYPNWILLRHMLYGKRASETVWRMVFVICVRCVVWPLCHAFYMIALSPEELSWNYTRWGVILFTVVICQRLYGLLKRDIWLHRVFNNPNNPVRNIWDNTVPVSTAAVLLTIYAWHRVVTAVCGPEMSHAVCSMVVFFHLRGMLSKRNVPTKLPNVMKLLRFMDAGELWEMARLDDLLLIVLFVYVAFADALAMSQMQTHFEICSMLSREKKMAVAFGYVWQKGRTGLNLLSLSYAYITSTGKEILANTFVHNTFKQFPSIQTTLVATRDIVGFLLNAGVCLSMSGLALYAARFSADYFAHIALATGPIMAYRLFFDINMIECATNHSEDDSLVVQSLYVPQSYFMAELDAYACVVAVWLNILYLYGLLYLRVV